MIRFPKKTIQIFFVILQIVIAERDYCKSFRKYEAEMEKLGSQFETDKSSFREKCSEIPQHQEMFALNLVPYNITANKFVGMHPESLKAALCGSVPPRNLRALPAARQVFPPVPAAYEKAKNWCLLHNPPRDQQSCGACWAFSAIAVIEATANRNWGEQVMLSEQMLIDCSTDNLGCDGGWPTLALDYSNENGVSANKYLYTNTQGRCAVKKFKKAISPDTFIRINEVYLNGNEETLKRIVYKYGSVAVVIAVPNEMFVYGGGVFMSDSCSKDNLEHAVVICGYGTDASFGPYWVVRNSWGANWGEKGYIKIAMGRNTCGIATYAMWVEM